MGLLENQEEADRVSMLYRNLEDRLMANIIRHCRTYKSRLILITGCFKGWLRLEN